MSESSEAAASIAGRVDGVPERFVPAEMQGELVEAEHIARYEWASRFCTGLRVLDAGCGAGYGSAILSAAGAAQVVAVDIAESVVAVAEQTTPDGVRCEVADLASLPYDAETFDVAVCFEVIEHVDDGSQVLDELTRVLSPGGTLLISSPVRGRYVPGNPHHRHEYLPQELEAELQARFPLVTLVQQHLMLASVLSIGDESDQFSSSTVLRMISPAGQDGTYVLAIASHSTLDPGSPVVSLTRFTEIRQWLEHYEGQDSLLRSQASALQELGAVQQNRHELLDRLAQSEQTVAQLFEELHAVEASRDQFRGRAQRAERVMSEMKQSISWRSTSPLRRGKAVARRFGSRDRPR